MLTVAGHYSVPAIGRGLACSSNLEMSRKTTSVTRGLRSDSLSGRNVLLPAPYALVNAVTLSV
ncbi:hypothetical protein EV128_12311 [Rhizobium azibense]|nr:hypothetical protein EV128_12311 [Rhizobium azibense]